MRVVLDTGVVLSSLVVSRGLLAWLPAAWRKRQIVPLISRETTQELLRALAYPKFGLTAVEIQVLLGAYLPWTQTIALEPVVLSGLPVCRDPHDQVFLQLAAAGNADLLVSGDRALLELDGKAPFAVVTPAEAARRIG